MQKEHEMRFSDCKREMENAVADGLIEEYTNPGFKGQMGYRIPEIVEEVGFYKTAPQKYERNCM